MATSDCTWFTWYTDNSVCWLLKHCDDFESCEGCISGPAAGADVDDCFGTPTTSNPATTHTAASTTEGGTTPLPATTTTKPTTTTEIMTTTGVCGVFSEAACDIDDMNTLDVRHDLTVGTCQVATNIAEHLLHRHC